jgi:hypothetical protein
MRVEDLFEEQATKPLVVRWAPPAASRGALADGSEMVVWVDPAKIDAGWASDKDFYVGMGGTVSAIAGRYERFGNWFKGGAPVEMSEVGFDHSGRPFFSNGRHRFAWMRDHGAQAIPVITDADRAKEFEQLFGTISRTTVITEPTRF